MRIGVIWETVENAQYRALAPMKAMERRGHEVVWPPTLKGHADGRRLSSCDVVHVYRRVSDRPVIVELVRSGIPIVYDNDDDLTTVPSESPEFKHLGGLKGRRAFAESIKIARMAHTCTTTTEHLASRYRRSGLERVEVIGNYLSTDLNRPTNRHPGIVIGWVAGLDHRADAARIGIAEALERVLERHEDVRVECIGVDLRLSQRYRHDLDVDFSDLPARIGGWDIGIAPLADIPFNHARSDIKLKEYAALGVPWLASPVGPYVGLGEEQGGRLVPDDGWFEALDRLVSNRRERRRLAKKAKKWAKGQTIEAVANRWEAVFLAAAESAGNGVPATSGQLG